MLYAKLLLISIAMTVFAETEDRQISEKIDKMKSSVSKAELSQRKLYRSVLVSDKEVKRVSEERRKINDKVLRSEADSQELAFEVREWESKVKEQRNKIGKSVSHIYRLKNPSLFTFLFADQSASEIEKNVRFLKRISEKDFERFKTYQTSLKQAKIAREKLKSEVRRLLSLRENLKGKEAELLKNQHRMSKLLKEIRSNKEKNMALLKQLRSKLPELDQERKIAIFEKKGDLLSPVEAAPTTTYGSLFDPVYRVKLLHLGWTFENLFQNPIKAVFQGKVVFMDHIDGYGNTIILDHGDQYYSVYSHNDRLMVFPGEEVFQGQTIAQSSSRLYFELRHFSNAIDPSKWISETKHHQVAQNIPSDGELQ